MLYFQFGRWSLLTAGILYGVYNHNRFSKKEAIHRKLEAEKKVVRDAQEAIEKKKRIAGNNTKLDWFVLNSTANTNFAYHFGTISIYRGTKSIGRAVTTNEKSCCLNYTHPNAFPYIVKHIVKIPIPGMFSITIPENSVEQKNCLKK